MGWIWAGVASAIILGLYDLLKKHAVTGNAVLPVLFWGQIAAAAVWLPLIAISRLGPETLPSFLQVAPLTLIDHLRLLAKSVLVGTSWVFAYFALKNLPVSLVAPIRATSPVWTLFGAILLYGERPSAGQWLGIIVTIMGFLLLSLAGKHEGVRFHRDQWVLCVIAATLLGAASSLYDKYLLNSLGYDAATVQAWFSVYLVIYFTPLAYGWWRSWWPRGIFRWRWSIPVIGWALLAADFLYFRALEDPEAMISVLACVRRGSAVVSFAGGLLLFRELNGWRKLPALLSILMGVILLVASGS